MNYTGVERRRSIRVSYPFELLYKDRNKNSQGFKHAHGKNLSENGLLFETYENFPACTILELRLEFPVDLTDKKFFNILAEVVRAEKVKKQWLYHIGVSFCKIDNDCRKFIREYIHSQQDTVPVQADFENELCQQEIISAT